MNEIEFIRGNFEMFLPMNILYMLLIIAIFRSQILDQNVPRFYEKLSY